MVNFDFNKAQEYEFKYSKLWLENHYEKMLSDIDELRSSKKKRAHYFDLFFNNDEKEWEIFSEQVKEKNCLEISSGPCGIFPLWGHWITGKKTIVDPLILRYDKYLKEAFGRSWFENVELIASGAEILLDKLVGTIDGFILFRNGIDHFDKPFDALKNMTDYAKSGCILLFWGDIKHLEPVDEGHMQIVCESEAEFESHLVNLGWNIKRRTPALRDARTLEYGCVATKI